MNVRLQYPDNKVHFFANEKLMRILRKEEFREFLIENKAHAVVLDNCEYSTRPNTLGCFYNNNWWIAYETDDRSEILEEDQFQTEEEAFSWIAEREGLKYTPDDRLEALLEMQTNEDESALELCIYKAITRLTEIANKLSGTKSQAAIKQDVKYLNTQLFMLLRHRHFEDQMNEIMFNLERTESMSRDLAKNMEKIQELQRKTWITGYRGYRDKETHLKKRNCRTERAEQALKIAKKYG